MTDHLTKIEGAGLKPQNVVQAAEADLRLRARKLGGKADEGAMYAFAGYHVSQAKDAAHLIAYAIWGKSPDVDSPQAKPSTRHLYGNRALLKKALIHILMTDQETQT